MRIRRYRADDAARLFEVFHSAVHRTAAADYDPRQLEAWAPGDFDPAWWAARVAALRPYVVVDDAGVPIAYADLQPDGYIDHFFVAGDRARRGVGRHLMRHLLRQASARSLATLTADVSRTAQPFFARFGFEVVERREPMLRGVVVPNARMRRGPPAR